MKEIYSRHIKPLLWWVKDKMAPKQFILFSSILVGIAAALAVIILKYFARLIFDTANSINDTVNFKFLLVVLPIIGILLTVLFVDKLLKGKFEKGTFRVLYAIVKKSSMISGRQIYSQIVTSAFTVGMGGSAGLESPIVITGAALGSNYAQIYSLAYKHRTLLLGCGVAAGISAAFNAPIAGVLFVTEVLMVDVGITAFVPLIISAATGALVSAVLLDEDILLSFRRQETFHYENVPFYIVLGLLCGLMTVYYNRVFSRIESFLEHYHVNKYLKAFLGAFVLVLLIYLFPSLFGEGYESIKTLSLAHPEHLLDQTLFSPFRSNPWTLLLFVAAAMFLKVFATGLTLGSGGNGGSFAPSLFVGAYLGFLFSSAINLFGWEHHLPVSNFTIVGMAGVLSGIFHAPLTSIFLIGEITGGYELMIPLMIVSSLSFAISKSLEQHSMELKTLARMGHVFTGDKDQDLLSTIETSKLIDAKFEPLRAEQSLGELAGIVASSGCTVFPVLNANEELLGVVFLDNIRKVVFDKDLYQTLYVKDLMIKNPETISPNESMDRIMRKFDQGNHWYLPVVNKGKYIGFISKSSLLVTYREQVISTSID